MVQSPSKPPTSKPAKDDPTGKRLLIVFILVVVAVSALWLLRPNFASRDRQAVRNELAGVLDSIKLPGDVVYKQLDDNGCQDDHPAVLVYSIDCGFMGYKLFKGRDSLWQDMKTADKAVVGAGFKRWLFSSQRMEDFEAALRGQGANTLVYRNGAGVGDKNEASLELGYYILDAARDSAKISKLVKDGKVSAPARGEYVYGIVVNASYFSCRHDSLFQLPCPPTPR